MNVNIIDKKMIDQLYKLVLKAYKNKEIPVGAIIFDSNGKVVSTGYNNRQSKNDVLGHAEIIAIRKAEKKVKDWRLDGYYMLVNLEPCEMCSAIIKESRIDKVFFLLNNSNMKSTITINKECLNEKEYLNDKFKNLLTSFFDNLR